MLQASRGAGEFLVVMDADLQHPPAKLPELLAPLEHGEADFVLGSRYIAGGSTAEKWGLFRKINSRGLDLLAARSPERTTIRCPAFLRCARRRTSRPQRLTPLGYKIGLELMCKGRGSRGSRDSDSFRRADARRIEADVKQQFKYLEHLSRLYDFTFPRASPMSKFPIVTILSWLVALGVYATLFAMNVGPAMATTLAYPAAILVTAIFHLRYVRTQREFLFRPQAVARFRVHSLAEWAACRDRRNVDRPAHS